jgi:hypothetical protein
MLYYKFANKLKGLGLQSTKGNWYCTILQLHYTLHSQTSLLYLMTRKLSK